MKTDIGINRAQSALTLFHGGEGGLARFGLPELPARSPPRAQRKLYAVERARKDIDLYGSAALAEARERLAQLVASGGRADQCVHAQQIVDFMRHSRGPRFQVGILMHCSYPRIEFIWSRDQSAYERVYELSMAVATGIYAQSAIAIRKAMAALETRVGTESDMAQWNALADLFLSNSPTQNHAHPQLKSVQILLDDLAQKRMRHTGGDPGATEQTLREAREDVARRIKAGDIDLISDI
jgi:hypothetical protein